MPAEIESKSPTITEAEWSEIASATPRHVAAARLIVSSKIGGIPLRPYLKGDNDHAPVVQAVAEFCDVVYKLLDELESEDVDGSTTKAAAQVRKLMETFK